MQMATSLTTPTPGPTYEPTWQAGATTAVNLDMGKTSSRRTTVACAMVWTTRGDCALSQKSTAGWAPMTPTPSTKTRADIPVIQGDSPLARITRYHGKLLNT